MWLLLHYLRHKPNIALNLSRGLALSRAYPSQAIMRAVSLSGNDRGKRARQCGRGLQGFLCNLYTRDDYPFILGTNWGVIVDELNLSTNIIVPSTKNHTLFIREITVLVNDYSLYLSTITPKSLTSRVHFEAWRLVIGSLYIKFCRVV